MDKNACRKRILKRRDDMDPSEVKMKSNAITENLKTMDLGKKIMVYLAFGNECGIDGFISYLLEKGAEVYIPYCFGKGIMEASRMRDLKADTEIGAFGIRAPKKEVRKFIEPTELSAVIVPGVGFDLHGNRLGFGGGYYDRYLPRTSEQCKKIAVCYEFQTSESLKPEDHDYPMEYIVTEDRIYKVE